MVVLSQRTHSSIAKVFSVFGLLVAGAICSSAQAQQLHRDPVMNQALRQLTGIRSMGDWIAEAAQGAANIRQITGDMSSRIASARARYWAAYPNGADFKAAQEEFERL